MPSHAFALSVRLFDAQPREQQSKSLGDAIDKIVGDVAKVNPALSRAIHDHFYVTPSGQRVPPGVQAFGAELAAVENQADKGKLDLDKVQIEGILLDIVKTDVMSKQQAKK